VTDQETERILLTSCTMYRVQGTMRDAYYGDEEMPRKSNLEAPRVTVNNKRMTNIQLPGGEVIQGIRGNKDLGHDGAPEAPFEPPMPLKPLRYNPGLKCDAALEAMRPERNPKHKAITAGDKRIPQPQLPPMDQMPMIDGPPPMMQQPQPQCPPMMAAPQPYMVMNPYEAPYPSDLLSQIKMRNRRFQQSCAMEGMQGNMARGPMMAPPMMAHPQMMMMMPPQQPQMTEEMMMMGGMTDELSMIEQDLNMTRRATRPFIPSEDVGYFELQKQIHELETMPNAPLRPARFNADEFLRVEDLPAPKKVEQKEPEPERPKPAVTRQVGIADQIAIRSYVLGKTAKSSE
jgi:hypothetical protein